MQFALVKAKTPFLGLAMKIHIATKQHGTPIAIGFVLTLYVDFMSLIMLLIASRHWRSPRPSRFSLLSMR